MSADGPTPPFDGRPVRYGLRHPIAFAEVSFWATHVLPPYQHDKALAQLTGPADVHGPALAVRADALRLPGVPPTSTRAAAR